ncbi:killin [Panthera pardus]|uniref:Killin n=1 Tax=Panthera pardus TaxID=9691 RepID=A0A9W2W5S4_PANPR|nr:killin [Panthera pardus]
MDRRGPASALAPSRAAQPGAAAPASGRGRGDLGGFKRRWRDSRAAVGNYFQEEVTCFLVGELSKFPLPYDGLGGKCFASFARGAPGWSGSGTPSLRVAAESSSDGPPAQARSVLAPWEAGYTSTHIQARAPASPHRWPRSPTLADHRGRASWPSPFACYLPSKLKGQDPRSELRVGQHCAFPTVGERVGPLGSGISLASALPLRANPSALCSQGKRVSAAAARCLNSPVLQQTSSHYPRAGDAPHLL